MIPLTEPQTRDILRGDFLVTIVTGHCVTVQCVLLSIYIYVANIFWGGPVVQTAEPSE